MKTLARNHDTCSLWGLHYAATELGFLCVVCVTLYKKNNTSSSHPCGGGVEYLHLDPASRRRGRKGKSQIWDSKIWSRMLRDWDPRKTTLARTSSIYKRQTRPLVREGAPQKQDRNCQRIINIWSWAPNGTRHQDVLVDWPSIVMWQVQFSSRLSTAKGNS
jgi:hypothetical protein